ncbi:MAG: hypothetical protein ACYDAM_11640 [Leptospirales bacterium]
MSTVNFSVPEQVKQIFNDVFKGQNKSAIIAALMQEAVEREQRKKQGQEAYRNILERRRNAPVITEEQFRTAREHGRP